MRKIISLLILMIIVNMDILCQINDIKTLITAEDLANAIKSYRRVIVLFYGSCEHCEPAKNAFSATVQEFKNEYDINCSQIQINEKPEIEKDYDIRRPSFKAFLEGNPFQVVKKEQISLEAVRQLFIDLQKQ